MQLVSMGSFSCEPHVRLKFSMAARTSAVNMLLRPSEDTEAGARKEQTSFCGCIRKTS